MLPPEAPSWTDQLTAVDWPPRVPVTVALKLAVPRACTEVLAGETETPIAGAVTVTVALPARVASATLRATTWNVPVLAGAV